MTTFKLKDICGKGLGIISTSKIPLGTLILSESPLFTTPRIYRYDANSDHTATSAIAKLVQALPKDQQHAYFQLHNSYPKPLSPVLGICKTNALPLGVDSPRGGIFLECARFNHSCSPNAVYSWHEASQKERIYACQDIREGEEITVCYLSDDAIALPRSERREHLRQHFQFDCACNFCSQASGASDQRRNEIRRLDESIGNGMLIMTNPGKALKLCRRVIELQKEDDNHHCTLFRTYYDVFQVCVAHADFARAKAFAVLCVKDKEVYMGSDATDLANVKRFVKHPESHRLAGVATDWRMKAAFARNVDSEGFEEWLWKRAE